MDIKERFYQKLQEHREQLNELGDTNKGVSKLIKVSKRAGQRMTTDPKTDEDRAKNKKYRKVVGQVADRLEEEQLDELRKLSDDQKKKLQKRIRDKHDKAWDDTQSIRKEKKSSGPSDTKDMDKFRNRLAKIHNKLDEDADEEAARQKRLAKWVKKEPKPKKKGKNAELMAGWADEIRHIRARRKEWDKEKKLDEASAEKIGRYISKASKQKKEIQDKGYANKLEKGDLPKFEKRKKGVHLGVKKLTGQSKVPAK